MQKNDVAVIGIACRFPGAENYQQFWDNLKHGRSHIDEVPRSRWDWRKYPSPDGDPGDGPVRRGVSKWGGFLTDVDAFDAAFFRLSPLEAESTDPQQRIMLELAWSCIEDAAVRPEALAGTSVGVFLGSYNLDYKELQERELREVAAHHSTGTAGAVIANRISHFFDFRGPSVAVDTASSASLHALHLAVRSLNQEECGVALAGGINLVLTPGRNVSFSKTGMLSPTGSCKTFDERADGYVRGEGAGLVLLKPLADAVRDGDTIHGVIKGSAANHSGRTRTLTYPNDEAQAQVIADAIRRAGISPDTIGYVEAHGTGTPTGDPVEIQGLVKGFRAARGDAEAPGAGTEAEPGPSGHCGLGSVKPNIGHLEAAAGIAGFIKVLLAMGHGQLPGLHDFRTLNPRIRLEGTPFHIVESLRPWKPLLSEAGEPLPRRCGVSSFGFGGTNAHVVLEEAPPRTAAARRPRPGYLICLSARTTTALEQRLRDLAGWLDREWPGVDLTDLSATLLLGRERLDRRTALVVRSTDELRVKLKRLLEAGRARNCLHDRGSAGQPAPADGEQAAVPGPEGPRREVSEAFHLGAEVPADEYTEQLLALAEAFAEGDGLPGADLFRSVGARRLRLPTYAFDRRRFWITPDVADGTPAPAGGLAAGGAAAGQGAAEHEENRHEDARHEAGHEEPASDAGGNARHWEWAGLGVEESVEADLRSIAGRVLKLAADEIHPKDRLTDLGFDSVGNTQLALRVGEHFGIDVTPELFYTYFTLEMLRDHLVRDHRDAVRRTYADAPAAEDAGNAGADASAENAPAAEAATEATPAPADAPDAPGASSADDDAIAVIGMSGRFPQARTVDEFWNLLAEGREAIGRIPADRLESWRGPLDVTGVKGGWLPGAAEFDPLFFEISPKEAEAMDPRQRLLLQESWRALEDAGYGAEQLRDNTMGMFVGAEQGDYQRLTGDEETLTSGHDGILAARLGYFLNFSGPVLSINTACSAGLAAVHQACLSLRTGECDTAVAAGVNLLSTSTFFEHATRSGMLSDDGVCYAFDKRANGLVMAEAVAVVVLKPLAKAVADGDRIHAVIRASGVNYDGRTNGITAPSQPAQAALLGAVYERFGIDPAGIDHVVAHGTGTRLGDPIEVNALAGVFGRYTDKKQYCALTSAKTNVGHTLAASGVVSLIGLVQALRHETLPASLHCEQESDYINWADSPFYVNREARPWKDAPGRKRLGAVSSFGISGTNAHVVVEGYRAEPVRSGAADRPSQLLVLSAKTDEALRTRAAELLALLKDGGAAEPGLDGISATLLGGRHHFAHRCALVAATREEAGQLLQQFLDGKKAPQLFRGVAGRDFQPQVALTEYGNELIGRAAGAAGDRGRYQDTVRALADLYCQGYELAWARLFGDRPPLPVSLPGYPFARETYWAAADGSRPALAAAGQGARPRLHPLLDANESTLHAQRFGKQLSKDEFFLRDHVVDGKILLPGVAHMEMAYTAARLSSGSDAVTLQDIIWGHPIVMEEDSRTVNIELSPLKQDTLDYLVYAETDGRRTVFSQGRANYAAEQPSRVRGSIDIPGILARCTGRQENAEIFASFRELGFGYGETFQAIETLHCGETEALARIVLGDGLEDEYPAFTMHPSLFDAALNTLRGIGHQDGVLRIPFSLEELVVFAPIPSTSYCHATIHRIARDGAVSVNLAICDENGAECVRATGLVFKEFAAKKDEELHLYVPRWTEGTPQESGAPAGADGVLLVLDDDEARPARIAAARRGPVVRVTAGQAFAEPAPDVFTVDRRSGADFDRLLRTLGERGRLPREIADLWALTPGRSDLTLGLESLRHLFRAVHRAGVEQEIQYLAVLPGEQGPGAQEPSRAAAEALSGFARAMTPVNHLFRMNTLQLDAAAGAGAEAVAAGVLRELHLAEGPTARGGHEIRHTGATRSERVLRPWTAGGKPAASPLPLKEGGVYLISGGAGALGLHLATYLAQQCRARLVLLGRRQPDAERREKLAALEAAGAEVLYLACDVADRADVGRALSAARERFGSLDGVFHSAGIVGSLGVMEADQAEFDAVLAPKLHGTVHLDELTGQDPLDFFVLFSSIAAHVGDFGQGSYAAANRFLDAYAHQREALRAEGLRHGRSISVNWPYWDEGGMLGDIEQDGTAKTLYYDYSGMRGLRTAEGIQALLKILVSGETQVVVTKGERAKIEKVLRVAGADRAKAAPKAPAARAVAAAAVRPSVQARVTVPVAAVAEPVVVAGGGSEELLGRTVEYLKDRLSQVFR
ncbi:SDR family NAD(P)-dependent oxidoreductase, partial [Kitasatospora sp. NPDC056181]|uniref:SDR family NAD(P)-dependent oxidoreductase n=1 Tax=Kitasatospora sp. NPDC056181 TaxID=3345737 RepID=UPI0035DF9156